MKKSKGMLTIEAALVMPLVIYIVFIMISMVLFLYTRVYVALSTNHVANLATAQWYSTNSDFDVSIKGGSVIGQAIGMSMSTKAKQEVVKEKIEDKIKTGSPMKVNINSVEVKSFNYLIGQRVNIKVSCDYKLPLAGIFRIMGISKTGSISNTYERNINLANTEDTRRMLTYAESVLDSVLPKIKDALGVK